MRSRPLVLVVMTLVLMHQMIAGVFAGGTILCISSAGGIALQPMGMTCCVVHGSQQSADACCAEDATAACVAARAVDCQGCTDHMVAMQPTLPPHAIDLALPASLPTVIAVIPWPTLNRSPRVAAVWHGPERATPALRFLSTVILRC
jgi:hypothetical protein